MELARCNVDILQRLAWTSPSFGVREPVQLLRRGAGTLRMPRAQLWLSEHPGVRRRSLSIPTMSTVQVVAEILEDFNIKGCPGYRRQASITCGREHTRPQTDPSNYAAGMNLYAFVNNDPLNLIDPSGRAPVRFNYGKASPRVRVRSNHPAAPIRSTGAYRQIRPRAKGIGEWTTAPSDQYAFSFTAPSGSTLYFNGISLDTLDTTKVSASQLQSNPTSIQGNPDFNAPVSITITYLMNTLGTPYTVDTVSQTQQDIANSVENTPNDLSQSIRDLTVPNFVTVEGGDDFGGDPEELLGAIDGP